ncbi:MAG: glycoside hydrolase family 26 protein [Chlamydiota bacterium]
MKKIVLTFIILTAILGTLFYFNQEAPEESILPTWGLALDGYPIKQDRLEELPQETGQKPGIINFFLTWPPHKDLPLTPDLLNSLDTIAEFGAIPCLTWEPMYLEDDTKHPIIFREILAGKYDHYLKSFIAKIDKYDKPIMIRFGHEMNLSHYHWGDTLENYGPTTPSLYRQTFRYIVDMFRDAKVSNVLWVFNPNAESVPNITIDKNAGWNTASNYYPGNDYVDILGMDGYNWGTSQTYDEDGWQSSWISFTETFTPLYQELKNLAPSKPIAIFETASSSQGGDKQLWIANALLTSQAWDLQAITWFHSHKETDWHIDDKLTTKKIIAENTSDDTTWIRRIYNEKR